jgi:hypothetical protein
VEDGSIIEFEKDKTAFCKIKDVIEIPPSAESIEVVLNGEKHIIPGARGKIFMNGQLVNPEEFLIDRAEIITRLPEKIPPTVSQVLEYLTVNLEEQKGKAMKILVDGQPAGFTTPLTNGTNIAIQFLDRSPID